MQVNKSFNDNYNILHKSIIIFYILPQNSNISISVQSNLNTQILSLI